MTTLKDIAKQANVSVNTVSRVLNGKSKDIWPRAKQQADEIRTIAKRLNYVPNSAARAMRSNKFNRIGIVISGKYSAPFDFEQIMGIDSVLRPNGYSLSVVCLDELTEDHDFLGNNSFDGIIVLCTNILYNQQFTKLSANCIWADTNENQLSRCIGRDEYYAGELAATKIIELGYKKIIYVCEAGDIEDPTLHHCRRDRYAGVLNTVTANKACTFEKIELIHEFDIKNRPLQELISHLSPATAVITVDKTLAQRVAFHAMDHGLCVGRDFALASCDETEATHNIWPGLSRVTFNRQEMGRQAAEMVLEIIGNPKAKCKSRIIRNEWCQGTTTPGL
jgi:LacI family transcriptional regulator